MLEYFINMVIAYKEARANYFACKGDYSEEIEQGIGSELNATDLESHPDLEDRILPGRLEATLLLIYCGLKNPVFRHALSSKRGAIWTRCYDLYHGTNQEIEKNLYPTLIHLEESVKQTEADPLNKLPPAKVCSLEDIEIGTYLCDTGDRIILLEFTASTEDPKEPDSDEDEVEAQSIDSEVTNLAYTMVDYEEVEPSLQESIQSYLDYHYADTDTELRPRFHIPLDPE